MPPLDTDATGLTVAPGVPLPESHRHMSPYMAIYPLGLLSPDRPADKVIIDRSLAHISALGTRAWVGYSFCWAGVLFARDYEGDSAARYLKIFATNFCSPNSFHLNGDQKGGQYSGFTYRPFTLEGNFAYAAGVQEMLLQSYNGYITVFPAIPPGWHDVSFHHLRAEGGYLVDAALKGHTVHVKITATVGGTVTFKTPSGKTLVKTLAPGQGFDTTYEQ
jgi:alpha-L-fucosidase 2